MASSAVLIVTTIRAEEMIDVPLVDRLLSSLLRDGRVRRVPLGALSREDVTMLVRALTRHARDPRMDERVWAMSAGQPFIALEVVRALQQDPALAPDDAGMPERVRDLIRARLGRLGESARRVASVAAVIGGTFSFTLLQHATGLTDVETAGAVEELARRRILGVAGDAFAFTHDRIRDVAYHDILPPVRKALHGAVAAAIETV